MAEMKLPFKPFSLDEVHTLTGVKTAVLSAWLLHLLPVKRGEDHQNTVGLDYMQTFAVFVGNKYLHEGADNFRASAVVEFLAGIPLSHLEEEIEKGLCFPVPQALETQKLMGLGRGILVECPKTPLGRRLNIKPMLAEFKHNIERLYPNG